MKIQRNPGHETISTTASQETGLPSKKGGKKYVYVHFEMSWDFDMEYGFLPSLSKIIGEPGVNGVRENKDGTASLKLALMNAREKGGVEILPNDPRLGEFSNYLVSYPRRGGGKYFCDKWESATVSRGNQIIWDEDNAVDKFKQFRVHLRDNNIIPPMKPHVYDYLLEREKKFLDRYEARSEGNPRTARKAEEHDKKVQAMKKEWKDYSSAKVPSAPATPEKLDAGDLPG